MVSDDDASAGKARGNPIMLLDAGCGRHAQNLEPPENCHVVGIDISEIALEANASLNERIVGDLETYPLPESTFDLAICWDVLEHLRQPQAALDNIVRSLKPGGKLILGLPNLLTPKALLTKFTPQRFHVFVYKRVFAFRNAGLPGHGPFPTHLRWCLRSRAIETYAAARGLTIEELTRYPSPSVAPLYARHPRATTLLVRLWKRVFDGEDPRDSELRVVLRK